CASAHAGGSARVDQRAVGVVGHRRPPCHRRGARTPRPTTRRVPSRPGCRAFLGSRPSGPSQPTVSIRVRVLPAAERDIAEALAWYDARTPSLGDRLLDEVALPWPGSATHR